MKKLLFLLFLIPSFGLAAPENFEGAKVEAKKYVYYDRTSSGTFYCQCPWQWTGKSGGRVDLAVCGYEIRSQPARAQRIEWEHIVPASVLGKQRQCWQEGGRKNCNATDPFFNAMEADLHNLTPSVGEVNADRSNFRFGSLPGVQRQHGACDFKVDFKGRVAEPGNEVKGMIARVYFYMHDRYNLTMSRQQQQLFIAWNHQYPVTEWERERDMRIASRMGHHNPFVTGEAVWNLGHKSSGAGLSSELPQKHSSHQTPSVSPPVIGNKKSHIYHLPYGCPDYGEISLHNQKSFASEAEAKAAGFRKAGNCK